MSTTTAVKERAIRLNDDEVRSVLTMTEVVLYLPIKLEEFQRSETPGYDWTFRCKRGLWQDYREADLIAQKCPHGKPGDWLWVQETWQAIRVSIDPETGYGDDLWPAKQIPVDNAYDYWSPVYRATDPAAKEHRDDRGFGWRPSVQMPRWASRITFELISVGIQQLAVEDLWILSLRRLEPAS